MNADPIVTRGGSFGYLRGTILVGIAGTELTLNLSPETSISNQHPHTADHVSTTIPGSSVDLDVRSEAPASAPKASSSVKGPPRERLLSLDVFRGMTVAGMLLVNDPGTWSAIYPPLEHATWNGWTPTDLIFPFFLFIAGVTTHLSLEAAAPAATMTPRSAARSSGAASDLPLRLPRQRVPVFHLGRRDGDRRSDIPASRRRPAVSLANHGRAAAHRRSRTCCAALLAQGRRVKTAGRDHRGAALRLLVRDDAPARPRLRRDRPAHARRRPRRRWPPGGIACCSTGRASASAITLGKQPDVGSGRNLLDDSGDRHRNARQSGRPMDRHQKRRSPNGSMGCSRVGALGMMAGMMWNWSFPINKSIWTSSYVVFCAGMAAVAHRHDHVGRSTSSGVKRWTKPFVIYGMNPMVAFVGSGVMARLHLLDLHRQLSTVRSFRSRGDLQGWFRVVARAGQRVARVRDHLRSVLVRGALRAVPEEDLFQGRRDPRYQPCPSAPA